MLANIFLKNSNTLLILGTQPQPAAPLPAAQPNIDLVGAQVRARPNLVGVQVDIVVRARPAAPLPAAQPHIGAQPNIDLVGAQVGAQIVDRRHPNIVGGGQPDIIGAQPHIGA